MELLALNVILKFISMEKYLRIGNRTAIISFLCGTIIFALYFITSWAELLFVGYVFIVIVGLVNMVILIDLIIKSKNNKANKFKLYKTCGLILLNIPMMLIYCWIVSILMGTMRITLNNKTQTKLTNLKIMGCEDKLVEKIMPGQSKTVWVNITGDCSIKMTYSANGQQKDEVIAGYLTGGMGQKMNYNIGDKKQKQF